MGWDGGKLVRNAGWSGYHVYYYYSSRGGSRFPDSLSPVWREKLRVHGFTARKRRAQLLFFRLLLRIKLAYYLCYTRSNIP